MGDGAMCHDCRRYTCWCEYDSLLWQATEWARLGQMTTAEAADTIGLTVERFAADVAEASKKWRKPREVTP